MDQGGGTWDFLEKRSCLIFTDVVGPAKRDEKPGFFQAIEKPGAASGFSVWGLCECLKTIAPNPLCAASKFRSAIMWQNKDPEIAGFGNSGF